MVRIVLAGKGLDALFRTSRLGGHFAFVVGMAKDGTLAGFFCAADAAGTCIHAVS